MSEQSRVEEVLEEFPKIVVVGERPLEAVEGWFTFNASRPLSATMVYDISYAQADATPISWVESGYVDVHGYAWKGDFIRGVFFVAVSPNDPRALEHIQDNLSLDAAWITWIDRFEYSNLVRQWAEQYLKEHKVMLPKLKLDDHPLQTWDETFRNYEKDVRYVGHLLPQDVYFGDSELEAKLTLTRTRR